MISGKAVPGAFHSDMEVCSSCVCRMLCALWGSPGFFCVIQPCFFAEETRRGETGSNSFYKSGKLTLAMPVACFGFGGQCWR